VSNWLVNLDALHERTGLGPTTLIVEALLAIAERLETRGSLRCAVSLCEQEAVSIIGGSSLCISHEADAVERMVGEG
jgi:hypothetical protein